MEHLLTHAFTLGVIGAVSPEVVRLYRWRTHRDKFDFPPTYFLISILYASLGGLIAYLLTSDASAIGSLYTGAALPFILDAGIKAASGSPGPAQHGQEIEETEVRHVSFRDDLLLFSQTLVS